MAWKWLEALSESTEDKKTRQINELTDTDEFRELVAKSATAQLDELTHTDEFSELVAESATAMVRSAKEAEIKRKEDERKDHVIKLAAAKEAVETIGNSMRDSHEPFCNVISMGFDKELGIKVNLDYNDAFIRYLNAAGIKGPNDEATVRMWLAHLNYDIQQEDLASDHLLNGVADDDLPEGGDYDKMFGMDEEGTPLDEDPIDDWPEK